MSMMGMMTPATVILTAATAIALAILFPISKQKIDLAGGKEWLPYWHFWDRPITYRGSAAS
jgi:hypothetical protein